ncbi:MAG: DUF2752 domain-containing protein [Planctomycetota bacterium]|jgi:hypothetical protein
MVTAKHTSPPVPTAPWTVPLAEGPLRPSVDRAFALLFAGIGSVGYGALVRIEPDARGHGTHEQLGMEACGWPLQYGIPCPTCGCTTAACQLVHGRIVDAFVTQPFGAAVAAFGLLLAVHATLCLLRGRSFVDLLVRFAFWRWIGGGLLLLLASWGYKYLTWPHP